MGKSNDVARRAVTAGLGAALTLVVTIFVVGATASADLPTEPLGQIDVAAGGPGLETNPLAVSEEPFGVAVHGTDVYTADAGQGVVRVLDKSTGMQTVFAGDGENGISGMGGPASAADIEYPIAVATDANGDVFFLSEKSALEGELDNEGNVVFDVPATSGTQFGQTMTAGDIYIIAGNGIGPALLADNIAADAAGNVFIGNTLSAEVLMAAITSCTSSPCPYDVSPYSAGAVLDVAGSGSSDYGGDGGPALDAAIPDPRTSRSIRPVTSSISDPTDNRVREVNPVGTITTLIGGLGTGVATGVGQVPGPVAFGDGSLYVGDQAHNVIRKIDPSTGVATVVAGDGQAGDTGDSTLGTGNGLPATQSELGFAFGTGGMAVDPNGDVCSTPRRPSATRSAASRPPT